MSTTEQRLAVNRANALGSTGPISDEGKAMASRNATRHGLLSARLFLDDEPPAEFDGLVGSLLHSLSPVGAVEETLVERIAVTIWRQRRLVQAETASLALARQLRKIASDVSSELGKGFCSELKQEELAPFDAGRERWCRAVLEEIKALDQFDLATLEQRAPLLYGQIQSEAAEDRDTPAKFIADYAGGMPGYLAQLSGWCREQLRHAAARPHILALSEHVRAKRLVLPADALELLARYQTTLDNQMFKLLRALRDAQEWRFKTLEPGPAPTPTELEEIAEAA